MKLLLLTTVGEWLETNLLGLIIALVGWLSSAAVLIWKLSGIASQIQTSNDKMEALALAFKEHEDSFDIHKTDSTVHTTFEFRQSVNGRLDRLEDTVKEGHLAIEAKIDRWAEKMLSK